MTPARARRSAVSLLAGVALVVTPSVFLLMPASAAGAVITVLQSHGYVDPLDGDVIVGELQNTGTGTTGLVALDITWWGGPGGTGTKLGTDVGAMSSTLERIPTGTPSDVANRSPFRALVNPPPGYVSYTLTATPSDPTAEPNHNFRIDITSRPSDPADTNGFHHIVGTITNTNTTPADNVTIVTTMYDGNSVVDEAVGFVTGASTTLDAAGTPGSVGHFDLPSEGSGRTYTRVAAIAESSSAAAPAAGASPSPSATTASPTASPTASSSSSPSPTASASVTPSATGTASPSASASSPAPTAAPPLPCRTGGGTYGIAVTPSYAKILKGGRVRLNAALTQGHRACQSGIPMSVYVRGPGTTVYHLSRGLTTGSTGKALTDYTGVRADFRWYVLSSGVRSATGLVQAR